MTTLTRAGREIPLIPKGTTPPPAPAKRGPKERIRAGYWTAEHFARDTAGMRPSRSLEAARAVLVDGHTQAKASAAAGISRQALKMALHRVRKNAAACPTCGQPLGLVGLADPL